MSLSASPLPVQLACGHFLVPHTCPVSAEQPLSRAVPHLGAGSSCLAGTSAGRCWYLPEDA